MSKPKSFDSWPPEKQEEYILHRREMARKRREKSPEKHREAAKQRRAQKRQEYNRTLAEWRKANPEKHRDTSKKWATENPERVRKNIKRWQKENPERVLKSQRKRVHRIADSYVANRLGLPVDLLREHLPNLLESKRRELLLKRQLNPKHK